MNQRLTGEVIGYAGSGMCTGNHDGDCKGKLG